MARQGALMKPARGSDGRLGISAFRGVSCNGPSQRASELLSPVKGFLRVNHKVASTARSSGGACRGLRAQFLRECAECRGAGWHYGR